MLAEKVLARRCLQRSAIGTEDSFQPSVGPHMLAVATRVIGSGYHLGVVSGVGLGMGVLDFGGDRRRGRGSLG